MQVDNYNHVTQLKRLGLDPSPAVTSPPNAPPPAASANSSGWASFGSPTAFDLPAQESSLAPLRTNSSTTEAGSEVKVSPNKARSAFGAKASLDTLSKLLSD